MAIPLEGNRKLIAGSLAIIVVFVAAMVKPELFVESGVLSFGMTVTSIVGLIGGANVMEWFARRTPVPPVS